VRKESQLSQRNGSMLCVTLFCSARFCDNSSVWGFVFCDSDGRILQTKSGALCH